MNKRTIKLTDEWLQALQAEFELDYMKNLSAFLRQQRQAGRVIYPSGKAIFNALNTTPISQVKVVILGQDPYHGPNQAHGLSFSVPMGVPIPPSLVNIYKELVNDVGITPPTHGHLLKWAQQGVFLLNSVLTVQQGQAGSHQGMGWETFTDKVVQVLNDQTEGLVFLLWGAYAQKKGLVIDTNKHLVLQAPHPSPLSAHRGFLGCRHFSKTNSYLQQQGHQPIDWQP